MRARAATRSTGRNRGWLWLAPAVLVAALLFGTAVGETRIPLATVIEVLAVKAGLGSAALDPIDASVIWHYRLSRAVVAACGGASLALSGLILQALLRNPLAEPYLLGISAGASTGAVTVAVAGIGAGLLSMSAGAFAGALTAFALVAALARAAGGGTGMRGAGVIILAGIAGSQMFNALTALIIAQSASAEQARGIMFWLLGNLSGVRWPDSWVAVPMAALALGVGLWHARTLDAFAFGAESAASLGIDLRRTQALLIGTASLATAIMVSIAGAIGFVGLVVPHAMRILVGPRHARLVPATALAGAVFLVLSDVVSRIVIPGQVLPIGVITALVGAPAFAVVMIRGRQR
ncbi:iron ABC transporter permease (plasmid) [Paracoccus versutus]|uniref:Iron complex transport system permease protein n=1 Tax=Paracoccus versutus TaxID=34007 RepID=A0AAQ0KN18_PARVE|nr:iron ABC transporter permease [Paracoccus versutus]SFX36155.1 iron complex transport system permease protein [Paracoccus pantotrophus]KGJ10584.1 ABC transporter permease [Paracoccus versutus]MCJ1899153.1 iron ABC transporter permease [Paracoccus versutus]RDD73427.1 iron ABC transporter permease [Paracoccus versutus]REG54345.1 iron complex transport system permease protein [Paracoccus versutus]